MPDNKKLVVGIVAHVDSGKTTLSESILYNTGIIKKLGRVDDKDTFLDTNHTEKERGITIYSKDARFTYNNTEFVLIDTPGHVDFSTEMERVLMVLDACILIISGSSGVQSHTKTLWSLLRSYKIPTFIFVNKMDMPGTSKEAVLTEIKSRLSDAAVDFSCQEGEEFYENAATCSEDMLNDFLDSGSIKDELIEKAISDRLMFPVFFGSALKNEGVNELLYGVGRFMRTPEYDENANVSALVYKISRDESGKRLTHIKILGGTLKVKELLGEEKVNDIRLYSGSRYSSVPAAKAGEICAIAGLNNTHNGDAFGNNVKKTSPILAPAISYAVKYPREIDTNSMLANLKILEEEDPSLNVIYNEQTKEINVSLMGDVQTEIVKGNIQERFGINVEFADGKVCYKETVDHVVEGVGHFEPLRHYAETHIKIEPLERNSGIQFDSRVSEDLLAKNWQRLIMTHLMEREHRGVLTGAPITDVKLSLISGKAHLKHTEGGDFRQATYRAIRQGLMELKYAGHCRLLEPYYEYTLAIPDEYVGRAMTDINRMSGTSSIAENDHENKVTVLTGRAPVSTMNGYVKEVTAYTRGLGHLSLAVSGYDLCHNEEEVLMSCRYDADADLRNPSSSVFCSHGAGTVVPWDEVPEYMHLSYASKDGALGSEEDGCITDIEEGESIRNSQSANKERRRREYAPSPAISTEEIDDIIRKTGYANENGRSGSYKGISEKRKREDDFTNPNVKVPVYHGAKKKPKYNLIDGYNVIHAWKELSDLAKDNIDGAAGRLNDILCNYQAITGVPLMVVYDAYRVKGHAVEEKAYNNITVVYTKEAQTADRYIEQYAHENSNKYDITVVTSDGIEQVIVRGAGAFIISSREFEEEVTRIIRDFNEKYNVH